MSGLTKEKFRFLKIEEAIRKKGNNVAGVK